MLTAALVVLRVAIGAGDFSFAGLFAGNGSADWQLLVVSRLPRTLALLTGFACLLFRALFNGAAHSLHLMLLAGIVFGLLFRSLSSFVMRLIDPNEFMVLQDRMFASFNAIQTGLLWVAAIAIGLASLGAWRLRRQYDALTLGREIAVNLGIDYRRTVMFTLALIAVMVSVSTALVGPVTFFGLLVSNLPM